MKAHVIYGPPGTGKSTELITRMKKSIESGVDENRIGFVSFTKAAAHELAHRVGIKPGYNISTIHSVCFRLAGIIKDQVIDYHKLKEFSKIIGLDLSGANPEENEQITDGDLYLALYNYHHTQLAGSEKNDYKDTYCHSHRPGEMGQFIRFCVAMDGFKKINGYIDFNDMLKLALHCEAPDIDVLFVDEAQDLSPLQWKIVYHWCDFIPEVHVAGDEDQSIYVWGGADARGMTRFEDEFLAERKILEQSYRIPASVHTIANNIISRVENREEKKYRPRDEIGIIDRFGDAGMVKVQHGENVLVLFRNHSLRQSIEYCLVNQSVPYIVDSGKPGLLQGYKAKAAITWSKIVKEFNHAGIIMTKGREYANLLRNVRPIIKKRIENEDLDSIIHSHWVDIIDAPYDVIKYLMSIESNYGSLNVKPTIHLSTIHGSKGREADRVILINGMTTRSSEAMLIDSDSEYRTFYVGATRARHRLDIVMDDNPLSVL